MWIQTTAKSAKRGKRSAKIDWQAALQEHDRWLRTIVYSRLREPAAVDDVMQEVALAAVRESAPPTDPAKVAPWLYRVAVRQTLIYRRKAGRRRKFKQRYTERAGNDSVSAGNPLDWLLAEERRSLVRRALHSLEARDAEILLLKYTENWSYHQISDHLGISHSAVEARLHRARQRMRAALVDLDVTSANAVPAADRRKDRNSNQDANQAVKTKD